jgi:hypothetical protein
MNGLSKKLCTVAAGIGIVLQMSNGAQDKLPYAIIIGAICIVYKIVQGVVDIAKLKHKSTNGD